MQSSVAESKTGLGGLLFVEPIVHLSNFVYLCTGSDTHRTFVSWKAGAELVTELPEEGREGETERWREWQRVSFSRALHSDGGLRKKGKGAIFMGIQALGLTHNT